MNEMWATALVDESATEPSLVAAPRAWNRLPTGLKQLQSTDSFRRQLKTFLFHSLHGY